MLSERLDRSSVFELKAFLNDLNKCFLMLEVFWGVFSHTDMWSQLQIFTVSQFNNTNYTNWVLSAQCRLEFYQRPKIQVKTTMSPSQIQRLIIFRLSKL